MDVGKDPLTELLGCKTPEEFEDKMLKIFFSAADVGYIGSFRALALDVLSGLQKYEKGRIFHLLSRWANTESAMFFNGLVACFSVPDKLVDPDDTKLSNSGYQWLMNAYTETKSGLAVALIGLLSENNRAGRSEEQPGLALKCYEEAKSFGSDVGQVFLFEARDERDKGYTAKSAANLAMGDHVVNNVSKFSKPASPAAEVDDLPIDAVNYLPGCMREDLQGCHDDEQLVAAFKGLMPVSSVKDKSEGDSLVPTGLKSVSSSSTIEAVGNGTYAHGSSLQLENGKYGSSDKLGGGSDDAMSTAPYLGRGSTSPISGSRSNTPGPHTQFRVEEDALKPFPGDQAGAFLQNIDRKVQRPNPTFNQGNLSAAQTLAGMGLNGVNLGMKGLNGMGLGGSVAPSLQAPSVTADPPRLAGQLSPQMLQKLVPVLGLADMAAVEKYVANTEAVHGYDQAKQHFVMLLQQGTAPTQEAYTAADAVTLARLLQDGDQARMRNGQVGGLGNGGGVNFHPNVGLNVAQGGRGGNVGLPMNMNLNGKFNPGGYGPSAIPTPRGRGAGAGGRGNDMWNNFSQKPPVSNLQNGALNNLNLGSLTPAQIAQLLNGRGGAGQLQDTATQEQYIRLVLQQQQQDRDKNALQAAVLSQQLGAAGNLLYGGDAATSLVNQQAALRNPQVMQQMLTARMAEQQAQIAAQRYTNSMNSNLSLAMLQQDLQMDSNLQMKAVALGISPAMVEEAIRQRRGPQGVNPLMGLNGTLGGRMGLPQGNMNLQPGPRANNRY